MKTARGGRRAAASIQPACAAGKIMSGKIMRSMIPVFAFTLLFAFCLLPSAYFVQAQGWESTGPPRATTPAGGKPAVLKDVGIEQRLNEQVPLDLTFRDEQGNTVELGRYFGTKPVLLSLVYYNCPMLCNQVLNGMTSGLTVLPFNVGKEFDVVTVSFDARETPEQAAEKKKTYINWYRREGAASGWHFLTGDQASIDRLTRAVGFKYAFDPATNQFAHASGIMLLTPQGKLARYFYGVEYAPKDMKFAIMEAAEGRAGSPVDQLLLYCYHYDPATGKYSLVVMNVVRLGGIATIIGVIGIVWVMKRRAARTHRVGLGGTA
jgi:protein SCO1/2